MLTNKNNQTLTRAFYEEFFGRLKYVFEFFRPK